MPPNLFDAPIYVNPPVSDNADVVVSKPSKQVSNVPAEGIVLFEPPSEVMQRTLCLLLGLQVMFYIRTARTGSWLVVSTTSARTSVPVLGDGNCLFRTISFLLTGSEDQHLRIRNVVCRYLETNYNVLGVNESYVATSGMRSPGTWCTEVELSALASKLNCNIYVYSSVGAHNGQCRWLKFAPSPQLTSPLSAIFTFSLYVNHANENHYEPVVDL